MISLLLEQLIFIIFVFLIFGCKPSWLAFTANGPVYLVSAGWYVIYLLLFLSWSSQWITGIEKVPSNSHISLQCWPGSTQNVFQHVQPRRSFCHMNSLWCRSICLFSRLSNVSSKSMKFIYKDVFHRIKCLVIILSAVCELLLLKPACWSHSVASAVWCLTMEHSFHSCGIFLFLPDLRKQVAEDVSLWSILRASRGMFMVSSYFPVICQWVDCV